MRSRCISLVTLPCKQLRTPANSSAPLRTSDTGIRGQTLGTCAISFINHAMTFHTVATRLLAAKDWGSLSPNQGFAVCVYASHKLFVLESTQEEYGGIYSLPDLPCEPLQDNDRIQRIDNLTSIKGELFVVDNHPVSCQVLRDRTANAQLIWHGSLIPVPTFAGVRQHRGGTAKTGLRQQPTADHGGHALLLQHLPQLADVRGVVVRAGQRSRPQPFPKAASVFGRAHQLRSTGPFPAFRGCAGRTFHRVPCGRDWRVKERLWGRHGLVGAVGAVGTVRAVGTPCHEA